MKNFLRALRFALPYKGRIILSVVCAILAAAFWSLNFTAIYPVLKIIGSGKNLQEIIADSIQETQGRIKILEKEVQDEAKNANEVENAPPGRERDKIEKHLAGNLAKVESKLESARRELYRFQVAKWCIDRIFPRGAFRTLGSLSGLVVLGMALKG